MNTNAIFLTADEVAKCLEISKSQAYKIVRELNAELKSKGYLTVQGRVSKKYFSERIYNGKELLNSQL